MNSIYALFDPRNLDLPMYIGKGLEKRAKYHWNKFKSNGTAVSRPLCRWFEKLLADGIEPVWYFLEQDVPNWQEAEKKWIAIGRQLNPNLCNVFAGGNAWPLTDYIRPFAKDPNLARRNGLKFGSKAGKIGGRLRAESGDLARIASSGGLKGGKIAGPRTGGIAFARIWKDDPEHMRALALKGAHNFWHVKRNIVSPNCKLCKETV